MLLSSLRSLLLGCSILSISSTPSYSMEDFSQEKKSVHSVSKTKLEKTRNLLPNTLLKGIGSNEDILKRIAQLPDNDIKERAIAIDTLLSTKVFKDINISTIQDRIIKALFRGTPAQIRALSEVSDLIKMTEVDDLSKFIKAAFQSPARQIKERAIAINDFGNTWGEALDDIFGEEREDVYFPILRGLFKCTQKQIKSFTPDEIEKRVTALDEIPDQTKNDLQKDLDEKQLGQLGIDTVLQLSVDEINKRTAVLKKRPSFFANWNFPDTDIDARLKAFINLPTLMESEEKVLSLSKTLNSGFAMDEKAPLSKAWKLINSSQNKDTKPATLKKKTIGVEIQGDNYTFSHDAPILKDFDQTTFLFSVELRGTNPGTYIQYWDGVHSVNSAPYNGNGKGEWETLRVEFTVTKKARFHRLYAAILGPVKGNDNSSVDIRSVKLKQK